jgi:hypothetical protein
MPYSATGFDKWIRHWIWHHVPPCALILDVGPGAGKYGRLLKELLPSATVDAVEIFGPYVERFKLRELYRQVCIADVRMFDVSRYELVILGDVIEHMTAADAQTVISRCNGAIVAQVPFKWAQGESEGNPAERHLQPDLSPDVMVQRYPSLEQLCRDHQIGVYVREKPQ